MFLYCGISLKVGVYQSQLKVNPYNNLKATAGGMVLYKVFKLTNRDPNIEF